MYYLYLKSFHIIFIIAWMVSLLYLPRLFVYHSSVSLKTETYDIFLLMEKRLILIIAIPALILSYIFGFLLLSENITLIYENYFNIKLLLLLMLTIYQIYLIMIYKDFKLKINNKSPRFFKLLNEIPTVIMIFIILLVVLKPNLG